uniref:Reverse transcriptase domain, reverse transcriptase zinc-binding domain protein n=1 Tax=Tanacetum cinerariifolium TaxID=118510 RepID=A0A6L2LZE4_TANCI|nr:hypothetical protein [Tanacetum cinerariifolium]
MPFEEGRLSVKYLGVPLVPSRLVYKDCKELIDKVVARTNDWKNKSLSIAARLQLVGKANVAWDVVCLPKDEGGLGIRRLDLFNKALMVVHVWKLLTIKESLWVTWIHLHKIKDRNFWDLPCRGKMSWAWRKVLQLRPFIRKDMFRAGLSTTSKVADVMGTNSLEWPQELQVWRHMRDLVGLSYLPPSFELIMDFVTPMAKRRTSSSVVSKLVLAASIYFIWLERNDRLFNNNKRTVTQVIECIMSAIRIKLMSCRFKKSKVKKVDDEVRIQALVDGKRVNIKESFIRRTLRLDDAEEAGVPFFMFPRFVQLVINHQLGDMTHHKEIFDTPLLTKNVFANMKREGTGFSGEVTPLFANMLVQAREEVDLESEVFNIKSTYKAKIKKLESKVDRLEEENMVLKELIGVHSKVDSDEPVMEKEESSKQERKIADIDADVEINLEKAQAEAYNLDLDHQEKVLSMLDVNDEEPTNVEEVLEVVKAAKLITEVVTTDGVDRRGVIIQDPKETATTVTMQPKVQAKDKGKAILIEEPKPLKRQAQIKLDEEVARQLEAELNANVDWNAVIEQVQKKEKLTDAVMNYQALKRKPLTEVQARRNMIVYLKNMAGYKMNYFKGMTYDEIRPLFEKHYNYNQAFINEVNKEVKVPEREVRQEKEVEVESSKREGESIEKEVSKKQKMDQETEELKKHLQIVSNDDDDVYTDATPLALKILIIDYKIHTERNKPYFKIIRADGNHRMYPLTHFTLEQMINDVRLEVEDESEMSLDLLRLVRR